MSELTERNCSHCRLPLPVSDSGLRHFGTHMAHQEYECLRLLQAEIERLYKENAELRGALYDEQHGITATLRADEFDRLTAQREELLVALKELHWACKEDSSFENCGVMDDAEQAIAKAETK